MNMDLVTHAAEMHRQELQREAEQYRIASALPSHHHNIVRHTLVQVGVVFVRVGMKLKQAEMYREPQTI